VTTRDVDDRAKPGQDEKMEWMRLAILVAALGFLLGGTAVAHDASTYGGLYRSRNMGGTWLNADAGLFLNAALSVAVDPRDPNTLFLGTDLGLLKSPNGGRGWSREAPEQIVGAIFALGIAADGAIVCAATNGVFRFRDGAWREASAPSAALPARTLAMSPGGERVMIAGQGGLFRSVDGGASFSHIDAAPFDAGLARALALPGAPANALAAVVEGRLLFSTDGEQRWQDRSPPDIAGAVETVSADPAVSGRLWAGGGGRVFASDDLGLAWRAVGVALAEKATAVRGIAADPEARVIVLATDRGVFRSEDGGADWVLKEGALPVHLEAGPLTRDPTDPRVLYAIFSLVPYDQVWQQAIEGRSALARLDRWSLIGTFGFVVLLLGGGSLLVRGLLRWRAGASATG